MGQTWRLKVPWLLQPLPREGTELSAVHTPTLSVPSSSRASSVRGRFAQPSQALLGPHLPKEGTVTGSGILAILECYLEQGLWLFGLGDPLSAAQGALLPLQAAITPGCLLSHASWSLGLVVGRDT